MSPDDIRPLFYSKLVPLMIAGVWFCCVETLAKAPRERPPREGHWHKVTRERPAREGGWHTSWDSDSAVQKGV